MKNQNKLQPIRITELKEYRKIDYPDIYELLNKYQKKYDPIIILKENTFSINFVGILIIDNLVLIVYPKYFKSTNYELYNRNDEIKTIIKVITKFKKDNAMQSESYNTNFDNGLLSIMVWLINDYLKNGLYEKKIKTTKLNGGGEICWEQTIEKTTSQLNKQKKPIFLNLWTYKKESNNESLISKIHLASLNKIIQFFTDYAINDIFAPNININCNDNLEKIGNTKKLITIISKTLKTEFNTNKRSMLKKLLSYISKSATTKKDDIQKYGTDKFNLVWEDVCKIIFADNKILHQKIKSKTPKWEISDNITNAEKNGLIPDVVAIIKNNIIILDAKYYIPKWKNISDIPGIYDVIKQHLYQLAYNEYAQKCNYNNTKNAFIFPMQLESTNKHYSNSKLIYKGKVKLDFLQKAITPKLSDILIFELSPKFAYKYYLQNKKGSMLNDIMELFEKNNTFRNIVK
jgi:hypothetical protein